MRASIFAVLTVLCLSLAARSSKADSFFHLPCDPDGGLSVGGGLFKGHTRSSGVGNIGLDRIMIGMPRLELTLFENCGHGARDRPEVNRWWLGRVNVFGSIVPEEARLRLRNHPEVLYVLDENGERILDENGDPLTKTEDTLLVADVQDLHATTYAVGARASLVDARHFHVEAFYERTGTFGWREAETLAVTAYVNGANFEATSLVRTFADVMYRFTSDTYGLTIGVPINKPNTASRLRVTPFLTLGRLRLKADVEARIDPKIVSILGAFGADTETITRRRTVEKSSWSGNAGARLDVNDNLSFETSFTYGRTEHTSLYKATLSATIRFSLPSLRDVGRSSLAPLPALN